MLELARYLCDRTEFAHGYDLKPGWCWGFACRAIGGTSTPSNHSWGLALDFNAPKNPMASADWHRRNANRNNSTFPFGLRIVCDMNEGMVSEWERAGFRWGGRYTNRPDPMHFEFLGTPAQMAAITEQLTGGPPGMATQLDRMEEKLDRLVGATFDGSGAHGIHGILDAVNQILYDIRGVTVYTPNTIRHFIQDQDKRTRELNSEEHKALTEFIEDLAGGEDGPISISPADAAAIANAVLAALRKKPLAPQP